MCNLCTNLSKFIIILFSFVSMSPVFSQFNMLDATFGNRGKVMTQLNDTSRVNDIAIQPDGKIIVGGSTTFAGQDYFTLIRYNNDGSLDNTFGNQGKVIALVEGRGGTSSIAIQGDGKIISGGSFFNFSSQIMIAPVLC